MNTILFDLLECQPASTSKFHGGGEYIKAVFKNFTEKFWGKCNMVVFFNPDKFLDTWIYDIIKEKHIECVHVKTVDEVGKAFTGKKIDVFYTGMPYYYLKKNIPDEVRIKGTIHGLRLVEMPSDKYAHLYLTGRGSIKERVRFLISDYYRRKKQEQFYSVIDMIDELVCVSNHTKYAIRTYYPDFKDKDIQVFYTPQKNAQLCEDDSPIEEGKYILLMGGDRWVKNTYRGILAIERLFKAGYLGKYKVVVVGGLSDKIRSRIREPKRYTIKGYVETAELENLYKFSDIFVYPSLNEGFGMPPLEAMKYGVTCVISAICSLPEVCGDAVYYTNPYDIEEMSGRILQASNEKIEPDVVLGRFKHIKQKQDRDLDLLCEFIIS